jgi:hypothetical protein
LTLPSAQHPIGGRDEGYDAVIASFAKVAEIVGGGEIRLVDQKIDAGTDLAFETGIETGSLVMAGHEAIIQYRVSWRSSPMSEHGRQTPKAPARRALRRRMSAIAVECQNWVAVLMWR